MIITIDTTKDSEADIGKAILFLSGLINSSHLSIQQQPLQETAIAQDTGDVFAQLFDTPQQAVEQPSHLTQTTQTAPEKGGEPFPKVIAYGW